MIPQLIQEADDHRNTPVRADLKHALRPKNQELLVNKRSQSAQKSRSSDVYLRNKFNMSMPNPKYPKFFSTAKDETIFKKFSKTLGAFPKFNLDGSRTGHEQTQLKDVAVAN
jgi:hypothetical protein